MLTRILAVCLFAVFCLTGLVSACGKDTATADGCATSLPCSVSTNIN